MMRTANPALNAKTFTGVRGVARDQVMTIQGTVNKTAILLVLALMTASWTWNKFMASEAAGGLMMLGVFGGFITAIVTVFKKEWAPKLAPVYAALEGLFLGGISAMFEKEYPGIAFQAVILTFGVLGALLLAYKSRLIKPTENFKLGVFAATGGIALFYFITMIAGFFGVRFPLIFGSGPIGIGFSVFVVIIAALNLVLDFDFIEIGSTMGVPKYMEWYAAFGLMVTLVWLYIEILRLLSKLRSRR